MFKHFIHQIVFVFVVLIFVKKIRKKLQCQMIVMPQPLALNPLKDIAQVDEIDYPADFDFDLIFENG